MRPRSLERTSEMTTMSSSRPSNESTVSIFTVRLNLPPAERLAEPLDLLGVHRDDRHAQLARRALVEQPHDLRGDAHLGLVAQRTARVRAARGRRACPRCRRSAAPPGTACA